MCPKWPNTSLAILFCVCVCVEENEKWMKFLQFAIWNYQLHSISFNNSLWIPTNTHAANWIRTIDIVNIIFWFWLFFLFLYSKTKQKTKKKKHQHIIYYHVMFVFYLYFKYKIDYENERIVFVWCSIYECQLMIKSNLEDRRKTIRVGNENEIEMDTILWWHVGKWILMSFLMLSDMCFFAKWNHLYFINCLTNINRFFRVMAQFLGNFSVFFIQSYHNLYFKVFFSFSQEKLNFKIFLKIEFFFFVQKPDTHQIHIDKRNRFFSNIALIFLDFSFFFSLEFRDYIIVVMMTIIIIIIIIDG